MVTQICIKKPKILDLFVFLFSSFHKIVDHTLVGRLSWRQLQLLLNGHNVLEDSEKLLNNNLIKYDVAEDGFIDHVDLLLLDEKRK